MGVAGDERAQQRWDSALRRASQIVEPLWPEGYSAGPFSYAVPLLAMSCYLLVPDTDPGQVTVATLLAVLKSTPDQGRVGDRLTAALEASGQADTELGTWFATLRVPAQTVQEWETAGLPDSLSLPTEFAPDFRERLAGIVEWTIVALERSLAAETTA
jgi:hypothetical protein